MKDLFSGYYSPTEEEFDVLWSEATIVLDTNVLLNLYRCSEKTRDTLLNILQQLQERLWIPYQVGAEYHRNRLTVINSTKMTYSDTKNKLLEQMKICSNVIENACNKDRHPHLEGQNNRLFNPLKEAFEKVAQDIEELEAQHPNLKADHTLRDEIAQLFSGKVGNSYSKEKLEQVQKEAERRFQERIPPGFKDKDKSNGNDSGDLVLWLQTIDYAKENKKPVIFVTADTKEDWFLKEGKNIEGPRPELVAEWKKEVGTLFFVYPIFQFIHEAEDFLKLSEADGNFDEAIEEMRELVDEDERTYQIALDNAMAKLSLQAASIPLPQGFGVDKYYNAPVHSWMQDTHQEIPAYLRSPGVLGLGHQVAGMQQFIQQAQQIANIQSSAGFANVAAAIQAYRNITDSPTFRLLSTMSRNDDENEDDEDGDEDDASGPVPVLAPVK